MRRRRRPGIDALDGGEGDDRLGARDGLAESVTCGDGSDRVEADTLRRRGGRLRGGRARGGRPAGRRRRDDGAPPKVQAGGSTRQRVGRRGRVRMLATSSEPGFLAASGFLHVAGLNLPLKSDRQRVAVGGAASS